MKIQRLAIITILVIVATCVAFDGYRLWRIKKDDSISPWLKAAQPVSYGSPISLSLLSPDTGKAPLTVIFTGQFTPDILLDFGDGSQASCATTSCEALFPLKHTYLKQGKYNVMFSQKDSDFSIGTFEINVQ